MVRYSDIVSLSYAPLIEYIVYKSGDTGLRLIDDLASDTGAIVALDIVGRTRKTTAGYFTRTWPLSLWGKIGVSGELWAVNLN